MWLKFTLEFLLTNFDPIKLSGREQFHGLGSMYCRGAAAIILTYDVTSWQSLMQLEERFLSLTDSANSDCVFAVVGNKADLTDPFDQVTATEDTPAGPTPPPTPTVHKQVTREDAVALYNRIIRYRALDTLKLPCAENLCFETSAKTGYNVDTLFETLFELLLPSVIKKRAQTHRESPTVCLEDCQEDKKKSECCV